MCYKVKKLLKDKYDAVDSVGPDCFTKALVSLHAFTGYDRVSALAGLGKLKTLKITAIKLWLYKTFWKIGGRLAHRGGNH